MLELDSVNIRETYERIRNGSEITWATFGYNESGCIQVVDQGSNFEDFRAMCTDGVRLYGFASFTTGDELSKRKKFVFITWIGENLAPMKKAQVSTHKAELRKLIQNVAVEVQASTKDEITTNALLNLLGKAGGANYGTGSS